MCKQIKFVTAVLLAVQDLKQKPFSVFDVTQKLRADVNKGELAFSDYAQETINGVSTYRVAHDEVKELFTELFDNKLLPDLNRRDTGRYLEYSSNPRIDQLSASVKALQSASQHSLEPIGTIGSSCGCAPKPPVNYMAKSIKQTNPFAAKVEAYLDGRKGEYVTMKQIQSRFKGVNMTCADYAKLLLSLGRLLGNAKNVSSSTVLA